MYPHQDGGAGQSVFFRRDHAGRVGGAQAELGGTDHIVDANDRQPGIAAADGRGPLGGLIRSLSKPAL